MICIFQCNIYVLQFKQKPVKDLVENSTPNVSDTTLHLFGNLKGIQQFTGMIKTDHKLKNIYNKWNKLQIWQLDLL